MSDQLSVCPNLNKIKVMNKLNSKSRNSFTRYALITLLTFVSYSMSAQYTIKGRVTDETNVPLSHTNVQLLYPDSSAVSGTITNNEGVFIFDKVNNGQYFLLFSYLGYNNRYKLIDISGQNIDIGSIRLETDYNELAEIQVNADRYIKRKDGLLIYPRKSDLKSAGSGYDVIYSMMIPGVTVDRAEGKVTKMGETVSLYMDGRKVEYREIQNIQPGEIEKIEYIDIPSGKYIQDNAAMNIILKQPVGGYLAVDATQTAGYLQGDYNLTAQYAKKNLVYSFFGGYNSTKYNNRGSSMAEHFTFPDYSLERKNNTMDDINNNNTQYAQFNLKSINDKRYLLGKLSIVRKEMPDNRTGRRINYTGSNDSQTNAVSQSNEQNIKPAVELYGGFKLPSNQNLDLSLIGSYNRNEYTRRYSEGNFLSVTNADEDFYNINISANYAKQFQNKNTISAYFLDNYRSNQTKYTGNIDASQQLFTNEALLYIGYAHHFSSKFMLNTRLGLSWLKYELKGENQVNQISPRANATIRYQISEKHRLSLIAAIGNSFPTANTLSNINQIIDSILIKRGNPGLDITKIYNGAIMYDMFSSKFNMQLMFINNLYKDMMIADYFPEEDKMIFYSHSNETIRQHIGVISGTWNTAKNLFIKTEIALINTNFRGTVKDSHTTFRTTVDANYSWKNFMLNLFAKAKEKQLTNSYIYEQHYTQYGGSIRWSNNNWHLEIGTNNPFTNNNYIEKTYASPAYTYDNRIHSKTFQQTGYLKLIYRFSFGKKYNIENKNINTHSDSAIMKAE